MIVKAKGEEKAVGGQQRLDWLQIKVAQTTGNIYDIYRSILSV
jgi:hypothetical protein